MVSRGRGGVASCKGALGEGPVLNCPLWWRLRAEWVSLKEDSFY